MKNHPDIRKIIEIFKSQDRYEAHEEVAPILKKLALDKNFLFEMIRFNLSNPEYLYKVRHYPTLAMEIFENETFSFGANLWLPLPNRSTNISLQSIHHHGNLLLSTISSFGPGYDSILFKKGFQIDMKTEEVKMEVDKIYHNSLYHLEFIDAYTPHVVFYPNDFSITYALWSTNKPQTKEIFKKIGILRKIKKPLSAVLKFTGLDHLIGVNTVTYFDFYPEGNKLKGLKKRITYKVGTNENFLQNVFHALQKMEFYDIDFLNSLKNNSQINKAAHKWIDKLIRKEKITSLFEEAHIDVPKAHLLKEEILAVVK
jgi:hypothetical protein